MKFYWKFKLQYFPCTVKYLYYFKSVATSAIVTFILATYAKMTPAPPITLTTIYSCILFDIEFSILNGGNLLEMVHKSHTFQNIMS